MKSKIGIILGSGLNEFKMEIITPEIIYEDSIGFHHIQTLKGRIGNKEVVLFTGRKHFYEGISTDKILYSVSHLLKLNIKFIIITNAAGGLNPGFKVADLMLITSHLNFINHKIRQREGINPYNKNLLRKIKMLSADREINLKTGTYCCTSGPMYETKSEIRMLNKFKVDAVGMSTVPEILYSAETGITTVGISCITNLLYENSATVTEHSEVIRAGKQAYSKFSKLLKLIIENSDDLLK